MNITKQINEYKKSKHRLIIWMISTILIGIFVSVYIVSIKDLLGYWVSLIAAILISSISICISFSMLVVYYIPNNNLVKFVNYVLRLPKEVSTIQLTKNDEYLKTHLGLSFYIVHSTTDSNVNTYYLHETLYNEHLFNQDIKLITASRYIIGWSSNEK